VSGISYTMAIGACALGPVIGGYTVQYHSIQDAIFVLFIMVTVMTLLSLSVFKNSPRLVPVEPGTRPLCAECVPGAQIKLPGRASLPIVPLDPNDADVEGGVRDVVFMRGGNSL